ncbi:TetR/AcrR family transcriptional regulator [Marmoricola sp. RAF53]|uniref:TetR/AcrR family transcriptional regulator n=1 Tax=Marmoricola sp. RAF53 TaxID=3233059 RepID=UPI003F9EB352
MEMTAQRRRGPRVDLDVREVLLDAAEELFGTEGVDAVSLRSVARAGGVAPAALTHHFPTKRDLLDAVVKRRGEEVAEAIRARLAALQGRDDLTTRELVEAVLMPFVEAVNADPVRAIHWLRIVITIALNGDEIVAGMVAGDGDIADLFTAAATGVPDLPPNAVELRAPIAMFSMLTALATADLGGYGRPIGAAGIDPEFVDQLALFTSSGLRAS